MTLEKAFPNDGETAAPPGLGARSDGAADAPGSSATLFGPLGVLIMLGALVAAAWFGQTVIAALAAVVLATAVVARLWSRCSLMGVRYERSLSERRAFPGEQIALTMKVSNRKLLPLPWLEVTDRLPPALRPEGVAPTREAGTLSASTALLWYRRASWRYTLQCRRRGYYTLGPVRLSSCDVFGLYPRSREQSQVDHVIVYPRIYPLSSLGLPSEHILGEVRAVRRLYQDPARAVGIRDHTPHDPLKHIHWKATARHQSLQVRVFESTTLPQVILLLAVDSFQGEGEEFELAVSAVASLADYLIGQGHPVGLLVNTRLADSGELVRIAPGSSIHQVVAILEALAKTIAAAGQPFADFVSAERDSLRWGSTLVIVASRPSTSLLSLVSSLREARHQVMLVQVGEEAVGSIGAGVRCYRVARPDTRTAGVGGGALAWEEVR